MLLNLKELFKERGTTDSAEYLARAITQRGEVFFTSDGRFSTHDLLEALLVPYSPAKVYLSTYSITEFPARILKTLQDEGKIEELHMLIDREFPRRYPKVDQFLQELCTSIGYTAVHAKILVIETKREIVLVLGSANWTVNPRLEAGVITRNKDVVIEFKDKILTLIHEANRGTIKAGV